jgi:hypothetical protein
LVDDFTIRPTIHDLATCGRLKIIAVVMDTDGSSTRRVVKSSNRQIVKS